MSGWDVDSKYTLLDKIGQGSYGSVYSAKNNNTGEVVAIKEIKGIFDDFLDARRMMREICVMIHLTHPCIVKIKEVIVKSLDFNSFFIVMEHAETDLKKLIRSPTFLDHEQVKYLLYQAVVGIRYMHSANILHRDLKPANILINSDCSLKICDFGLSRSMQNPVESELNVIEEEDVEVTTAKLQMRRISEEKNKRPIKRHLSGHVVTRWYRAPELILLEKNYDKEIDVWSLGCVFAELLSMIHDNAPYYIERGPIFPGKSCFPLSPDVGTALKNGYPSSDSDQINVIMEVLGSPSDEDLAEIGNAKAVHYIKSFNKKEKKPLNMFFPGSTAEEIEILSRMLVFNRTQRITIEDLLQHPYFEAIRNPDCETLAEIRADFVFDREDTMTIDEMKQIFMGHINSLS